MNYLLISNLALLLFFLIYRLGLKNLTFFSLNRWYLLSSIFIAYLMPLLLFVDFQVPEMMQVTLPVLDLTPKIAKNSAEVSSQLDFAKQSTWLVKHWVQLSYWIGVLITLCWLLYRVVMLLVGRFSARNQGSYSFLRIIKIADDVKESGVIQSHEELHVKQGHSYDILFLEIVRVFNWFNPVFMWMREELKFQHECIVDEHFSEDKVAYAELLVAYAMNVHPNQLSHEFSNKSILKERIKMIFKEKSKSGNRIFYLSLLPMALIILSLSVNCKSNNKEESSTEVVENTDQPNTAIDSLEIESTSIDTLKEKQKVSDNSKGIDKDGKQTKGTFGVFSYDKVDVKPEYPGGIDQFKREVQTSVIYTQEAMDAGAKGKVELVFVIDKEGKLTDIKVSKDVGYGLAQACITALKKTKNWKPAMVDGFPAKVKYTLPIRFDLSQM